MLRNILISIISIFHISAFAQICDFPLPPSNTCQNAPLLCSLDGYCSDNSAAQNSGTPNAFCGQVENNNWVSFIAGSTEFELEVTIENCQNNTGLQVQFFETSDCQNFTSVSNCLDPAFGVSLVTATGLNIGQVYYLMMDGKGGDVCDYSYMVTTGIILSPAEAVIQDPGYLCEGETLTLDGSTSASGTGITYEWSTTDGSIIGDPTTSIVSTDTPGTYSLLVKDTGGCEDSTSIEVLESPLASIQIATPDVLDCLSNVEVVLSGSETTGLTADYAWSTMDGNIISGENTQNPIVDAPGIYELIVTNIITGCTEEESVEVVSSVNTPVALAGDDLELNCLNPTITLDGSASSSGSNFTYEWSTTTGRILSGANNKEAIADLPGLYVLEVRNTDNDCIDSDEVVVVNNPEEPTSAVFKIENPCFGEDFGKLKIDSVIGGIAPYLFAIDSSVFTPQNEFRSLAPEFYKITIQDITGCEWDTTIQIQSQPELLVDLGEDETVVLGCEIEIEAIINFPPNQIDTLIWQLNAGCPGCYIQRDTLLQTTDYTLTVIDQNGCVTTAQKTVHVDKKRFVFIPNIFSPNGDGVNDVFMVHGGKDVLQIKTFRVFNRWGATLFERTNFQPNNETNGWDGKLKGENQGNSVYVYFAEVEFIDGRIELYKGDVVLVR